MGYLFPSDTFSVKSASETSVWPYANPCIATRSGEGKGTDIIVAESKAGISSVDVHILDPEIVLLILFLTTV